MSDPLFSPPVVVGPANRPSSLQPRISSWDRRQTPHSQGWPGARDPPQARTSSWGRTADRRRNVFFWSSGRTSTLPGPMPAGRCPGAGTPWPRISLCEVGEPGLGVGCFGRVLFMVVFSWSGPFPGFCPDSYSISYMLSPGPLPRDSENDFVDDFVGEKERGADEVTLPLTT